MVGEMPATGGIVSASHLQSRSGYQFSHKCRERDSGGTGTDRNVAIHNPGKTSDSVGLISVLKSLAVG